ncbi:marginal zone B- and B1-cell-specific protein-like [Haliotis rufescens]|uniref:marginal zone B- and B1-cell-specific protein-like n=1 Tax=Haliotis rufescens TaxID=6454 RepID=UPI001EB024BA|nr:marginal zone B- and B1-cell-specific protein-like [Haliotis rufescens]
MAVQFISSVFLFALFSHVYGDGAIKGLDQSDDGSSGTLSFKTPELDDEDAYSFHMPSSLKCDGCRVIAHLMYSKFDKIHKNRPSVKTLPEHEILDIFEVVCTDKFESCGVKDIKGVKRLSGPGLETADVPGVMQGGGKWPGRLQQMCQNYVGELGEEEIYHAYKEQGKLLEKFLCYGDGVQGDCSSLNKTKKKKGKKSKEEL